MFTTAHFHALMRCVVSFYLSMTTVIFRLPMPALLFVLTVPCMPLRSRILFPAGRFIVAVFVVRMVNTMVMLILFQFFEDVLRMSICSSEKPKHSERDGGAAAQKEWRKH
jgi:hypothetical protein